eukprot:13413-Pleurochrysis_carterae.AAC.1
MDRSPHGVQHIQRRGRAVVSSLLAAARGSLLASRTHASSALAALRALFQLHRISTPTVLHFIGCSP